MNNWFKQNGIHLAILGIFLVLCCAYLTPALQGKVLGQNDVTRAQSTQKEIMDYREKGQTILWTNQILGGMPAYQIWAPYSANITKYIISAVDNPICIVLMLLAGAYFLFSVLGLRPWLAVGGAIAFTFSSYNFIYLVAGHANQEIAIAFFAPIIASVILTLRGKYWWGSALLALFLALEIKANHLQMTYYLLIALVILMAFELYHAVKAKQLAAFGKSVAYMAAALVLAVGVNASVLWSTAEYAGDSIRGKGNLTSKTKTADSGVGRDYAYEFSEGVGETLSFLIPNVYGGATSAPANPNSNIVKALVSKGASEEQAQGIARQMPMYWGDKTFTEGPWYFGAVVCFFFVFGLLIVKSRLKWWAVVTVVLTMLLSFGRNFPFVSDIFFNYFPLYNKFRAVESILTITMLCFPILAFLAIDEAIKAEDKKPVIKKLLLALYITGGLSLIFVLLPDSILPFKSANHNDFVTRLTQGVGGDASVAQAIANGLVEDRVDAARADAIRSLIFVALAFGLTWAYFKQKLNVKLFAAGVVVLVLVDMWTVAKRYLKDESFMSAADVQKPQPREIDGFILRDTDPNYRVIDMSMPLMQDAVTPFFHKAIGGYSAARMKRYDELMENQMTRSVNQDVLDMLNTKYIISADEKGQPNMHVNNTACGHAWFVKGVRFVDNADQEMQVISAFSPKDEAVVDKRFRSILNDKQTAIDAGASIKLTSYSPDHMVYQSGSTTPQVAVFSEIYYDKGWKMLIDGVEKPYFRADYVLRAAEIPVGNHKIEFVFHPTSYYVGEKISLASSVLLVLSIGGAAFAGSRRKKA